MKKTAVVSRSGGFASGPVADVAAFSESISFDWRLWKHDIMGSIAHAAILEKTGVLTKAELTKRVPADAKLHTGRSRAGRSCSPQARCRGNHLTGTTRAR